MRSIIWSLEIKITPLVAIMWYQFQPTSGIVSIFCSRFKQICATEFISILYNCLRFSGEIDVSLFNHISGNSKSNLEKIPNLPFPRFRQRFQHEENLGSKQFWYVTLCNTFKKSLISCPCSAILAAENRVVMNLFIPN